MVLRSKTTGSPLGGGMLLCSAARAYRGLSLPQLDWNGNKDKRTLQLPCFRFVLTSRFWLARVCQPFVVMAVPHQLAALVSCTCCINSMKAQSGPHRSSHSFEHLASLFFLFFFCFCFCSSAPASASEGYPVWMNQVSESVPGHVRD